MVMVEVCVVRQGGVAQGGLAVGLNRPGRAAVAHQLAVGEQRVAHDGAVTVHAATQNELKPPSFQRNHETKKAQHFHAAP